ncbi:SpoIIE family protein phosphatase [Streptomyces sp. NPDC002763]|uniref:SpoIIE family protein phosphatase n=1 Tax=Streptomyces sp. NPDC002763 TaxID=3154427 RepID=UPI00332EC167
MTATPAVAASRNARHRSARHRRPHGPRSRHGKPLGHSAHLCVAVRHHRLQPGDRLPRYADGIVEARDAEGGEFGRDRFVDSIVRRHSGHRTLHETPHRRAGHQDRLTPWPVAHAAGAEPGFTPGPLDTRDKKKNGGREG